MGRWTEFDRKIIQGKLVLNFTPSLSHSHSSVCKFMSGQGIIFSILCCLNLFLCLNMAKSGNTNAFHPSPLFLQLFFKTCHGNPHKSCRKVLEYSGRFIKQVFWSWLICMGEICQHFGHSVATISGSNVVLPKEHPSTWFKTTALST